MKKQGLILIGLLAMLSAFVMNPNPPIDDLEIGKRGATHKEDLPEIVFNSFKMNDFEMLVNYIPNENELEYLKNRTPRKNKYIYESMDANLLKSNTQLNFDKVVEDGISKGINWSTVEIMDSKVEPGSHTDQRIFKGTFTGQDSQGTAINVSFDIIKVKNKWFVFQGIRMEGNGNKKASMK